MVLTSGGTGAEFLGHFRSLAGLTSDDRVLDIGCGIGRIARVMVPVLEPPTGSYDGFDVSRHGITWCASHYTNPLVPFRFEHVDLYHPEYNPGGGGNAEQFRFPYPDASFDLAIATSVFTHLLDGAVAHYLAETSRVLAPGGRLFATWLALDPQRPPDSDHAMTSLEPTAGAALVADPCAPEAIVAYPLEWIVQRLLDNGLALRSPTSRGPGPDVRVRVCRTCL